MGKCRKQRIEQGLTQQQVAEAVGITSQYYSYIESGQRTPPTPLAISIARLLNSTVEELFGGSIEMPQDSPTPASGVSSPSGEGERGVAGGVGAE